MEIVKEIFARIKKLEKAIEKQTNLEKIETYINIVNLLNDAIAKGASKEETQTKINTVLQKMLEIHNELKNNYNDQLNFDTLVNLYSSYKTILKFSKNENLPENTLRSIKNENLENLVKKITCDYLDKYQENREKRFFKEALNYLNKVEDLIGLDSVLFFKRSLYSQFADIEMENKNYENVIKICKYLKNTLGIGHEAMDRASAILVHQDIKAMLAKNQMKKAGDIYEANKDLFKHEMLSEVLDTFFNFYDARARKHVELNKKHIGYGDKIYYLTCAIKDYNFALQYCKEARRFHTLQKFAKLEYDCNNSIKTCKDKLVYYRGWFNQGLKSDGAVSLHQTEVRIEKAKQEEKKRQQESKNSYYNYDSDYDGSSSSEETDEEYNERMGDDAYNAAVDAFNSGDYDYAAQKMQEAAGYGAVTNFEAWTFQNDCEREKEN